jgi:uncharacterized protein (DUF342 family)
MKLGIVLISLVLLPSISCAEEISVNTNQPVLCFTEEDVKIMVVNLENANDYKEQVVLIQQANQELENQIKSLQTILALQKEQLDISKQTIESYKNLINTQKTAYEQEIKNNKPNFWDKILPGLGGLGVGMLLMLLL